MPARFLRQCRTRLPWRLQWRVWWGRLSGTGAELRQDRAQRSQPGDGGKRVPSISPSAARPRLIRTASSSSRFMAAGPVDIHGGESPPPRAPRRSLIRSASVSGYGPEMLSSSHSPARIGASRSHSQKRARRLSRIEQPTAPRPASPSIREAAITGHLPELWAGHLSIVLCGDVRQGVDLVDQRYLHRRTPLPTTRTHRSKARTFCARRLGSLSPLGLRAGLRPSCIRPGWLIPNPAD